jgi:mRNA-degrading endonuclease RelE of RelBE toxin-antitoxin system
MVRKTLEADISKIEKKLQKLKKKDKALADAVFKKILQIAEMSPSDVRHFKNLKYGLKYYKRAHVGSFVLFFKLEGNILYFERFEHHDDAY